MCAPRVTVAVGVLRQRKVDRDLGDVGLLATGTLCDALDDMAIVVARAEGHLRVEAGWILPQHGFEHALSFDDRSPVYAADGAQTRYAVGDDELRRRLPLRGPRVGLFGARSVLADPLLEPHGRRKFAARAPQLLPEA